MAKTIMFINSILVFTLLGSCNYDPPQKGVYVFIENQTDKSIFISKTFLKDGLINMYDTFFVNNRVQIEANGRLIHRYSKHNLFISDTEINELGKDSLFTIYIFKEKSFNINPDEIRKNNVYDSLILNINTIRKNEVNHVFIYDKSIIIEHKFSITYKK